MRKHRKGHAPGAVEGATMQSQSNSIEQWKPVVGYEANYLVSNHGNVRRVRPLKGRVEMATFLSHGYLRVELSISGIAKKFMVHRLVVAAFIGPIHPEMQINHKDGIKINPRLDNLEVVTASYNQWHATHILGKRLHVRGSVHGHAKLTEPDIPKIREMRASGMFFREIASVFGVSDSSIRDIVSGRGWAHISAK